MDKIYNLLGMARAARKISYGETMIKDIRAGKCRFVWIANDASDNTKKKVSDKCTFYKIPFGFVENSVDLSRAIGKYNIKAVGVLDKNFAKQFKEML